MLNNTKHWVFGPSPISTINVKTVQFMC